MQCHQRLLPLKQQALVASRYPATRIAMLARCSRRRTRCSQRRSRCTALCAPLGAMLNTRHMQRSTHSMRRVLCSTCRMLRMLRDIRQVLHSYGYRRSSSISCKSSFCRGAGCCCGGSYSGSSCISRRRRWQPCSTGSLPLRRGRQVRSIRCRRCRGCCRCRRCTRSTCNACCVYICACIRSWQHCRCDSTWAAQSPILSLPYLETCLK